MSRSVMMHGPPRESSITTAAPTPRAVIRRAASRSVWSGPAVTTIGFIPSRTSMVGLLSGLVPKVAVGLGPGVAVDLGLGVAVDLGPGVAVDLGPGVAVDLGPGVGARASLT